MPIHALPLFAAAAALLAAAPVKAVDKADAQTAAAIAPSGALRAAINLGNGVLAQRDASGQLGGASVVLAKALAERLGVKVELITYNEAGATFAAGLKGEWDVAFLAVDPKRAEQIDYSAPYVIIEGTYVVRKDSPFHAAADLDREGVRISVAQGAAYTMFLSRTLKHAQLVELPDGEASIAAFEAQKLDATASVAQALAPIVKAHPEWRMISPGFQTIGQAVALPKDRPPQAVAYLNRFLDEMKTSGALRQALDESGQTAVTIAP
jgi:polar amino acid transport system substrate-binding protein